MVFRQIHRFNSAVCSWTLSVGAASGCLSPMERCSCTRFYPTAGACSAQRAWIQHCPFCGVSPGQGDHFYIRNMWLTIRSWNKEPWLTWFLVKYWLQVNVYIECVCIYGDKRRGLHGLHTWSCLLICLAELMYLFIIKQVTLPSILLMPRLILTNTGTLSYL